MVTAAQVKTPDNREQEELDEEELDEEALYPSSDGKPMGETDQHIIAMSDLLHMLRSRFADEEEVYIAGNNFIYYEKGDSNRCVSPDAYVVYGVSKNPRSIYKVWREGGKLPNVVFEITSRSTKREDMTVKFLLYQNVLRVPEYFLFDPTGKASREDRLQGFRLENGEYVAITPRNGMLHSDQLDIDLHQDGNALRLFNCRTNQHLFTAEQSFMQAVQQRMFAEEQQRIAEQERLFAAEQQRIAEQERLFAAEQQRIAEQGRLFAEEQRLRAEQEHLFAEEQQRIAEQERLFAEEQQRIAEQERLFAEEQQRIANEQRLLAVKQTERAERAEAELARLHAELEALRKQNR